MAIIRLMGMSTGMKSATPSLLNRSVTVGIGGTYFPKAVLITPVPIPALVMLGPFSFSVQPGNNLLFKVTGKITQQLRISWPQWPWPVWLSTTTDLVLAPSKQPPPCWALQWLWGVPAHTAAGHSLQGPDFHGSQLSLWDSLPLCSNMCLASCQ